MSQSLALTNDELLRAMCLVAGVGRDPSTLDAATLSDFRAMIRSGLRSFFNCINPVTGMAHAWRFLERPFLAPMEASYSTGTVTIANGTATLSGGTWPTWAASGVMVVDGQAVYVTVRTSGTVASISHTGLAVTAGTYAIYKYRYALPADFAEFVGGLVYSKSGYSKPLKSGNDTQIRLNYASNFRTGDVSMYCLQAGNAADTSEWYLEIWPTGAAEDLLAGTYRTVPSDNLDSATLTVGPTVQQAGVVHSGTILEAILASVEQYYNDAPGAHSVKFQELLAMSIKHDLMAAGPIGVDCNEGIDPRDYSLHYHTPIYL